MYKWSFLPLIFTFFVIVSAHAQKNLVKTIVEEPTYCDHGYYKWVFGDEFEGTTLDTNKWLTYYPYGENARKDSCSFCRTHVTANIYRDENCTVHDGRLWLKSDVEPGEWFGKSYAYTSGLVHSRQVFTTYGKYEIRCKLPKGKQQWPAFWIFGWNTEIDVFEFICRGTEKVEFSVHKWLKTGCDNKKAGKDGPCYSNQSKIVEFGTDFSEAFHTFSMEYEPHLIKFYIDDVMVRVVPKYYNEKKKPVYHCPLQPGVYYVDPAFPIPGEPVHVIANQSVCRKIREKNPVFPNYLEIDYIRVFQKTIQPDLVDKLP